MADLVELENDLTHATDLRWALFFRVAKACDPEIHTRARFADIKRYAKAGAWESAALALVEEKLPGRHWVIEIDGHELEAGLSPTGHAYTYFWAQKPREGKFAAIALLLALIRALMAEKERGQ